MDRDSVVLEVGCGTGEFTTRIAAQVRELIATDYSTELLDRARLRINRDCPKAPVTFARQDVMNLQLPDAKFDAVFGCSVLHHVDAAVALGEVFRVLKPGGRCVFSEPNMLNPQVALQKNVRFLKRRAGDTVDESAFFRGEMVRLLRAKGFGDVSVRHFDFVHPLVPGVLIPIVQSAGRIAEGIPGLRVLSGSLLISACRPLEP